MRLIILVSAFLIIAGNASACEFCLCHHKIERDDHSKIIGISNSWRRAEWVPYTFIPGFNQSGNGFENSSLKESFLQTALFAGYSPLPKLRLFASLPYSINTLKYDEVTESRNALADLNVHAMYRIHASASDDSSRSSHRWYAGAGIKFPTGKSSGASEISIPMSQHLYSGTGSTDYLFTVCYSGKFKKVAWNFDATYRLNGESASNYRYGNTLKVAPRFFYVSRIKSVKMYPHVGTVYETHAEDKFNKVTREESDGTTLWGSAGVDLYFGKFSINTCFQLPVYNDAGAIISESKSVLLTSFNVHF